MYVLYNYTYICIERERERYAIHIGHKVHAMEMFLVTMRHQQNAQASAGSSLFENAHGLRPAMRLGTGLDKGARNANAWRTGADPRDMAKLPAMKSCPMGQ